MRPGNQGQIGIAYDSDVSRAIALINEVLAGVEGVGAASPAVGICAFGASSIDIEYRYQAVTGRYFETVHAVNLRVLETLRQHGVEIPFPQREVRLLQSG